MTFVLVLLTMIALPGETATIQSASIDRDLSLDDCTAAVRAFQPRSIPLPTGQRMTLSLTCEKS